MATAVFTTVEARVNQQLTNAIYADEIQDNINALAGSHRNQLVNGGMEVAQRGAGPFTAAAAYTLDRWQIVLLGSGTVSVTPETTTVDNSAQSMKCVVTGAGGSGMQILQKLEDFKQLRGRQCSLSLRVNQSVANGMSACYRENGASNTLGATVATTGSFVTLTLTVTPGAAATSIEFGVNVQGAAGTYYIDNAMLVIGPAPAPYRPLHPQEDLARCQRYYEVHGGGTVVAPAVVGNRYASGAGVVSGQGVSFAVPKGGVPTVTKNGTWNVVNCGQPTITGQSTMGYVLVITSTALGMMSADGNSADDTVTSEWNP